MDDNLDESLNLDGSIGVDFEEGIEANILDTQEPETMKYDIIEEQQVLMDTEGEEVIEFMGDEFVLNSDYIVTEEENNTDKSSLSLESGIDGNTIVESIASTSSNSSLLKDNITEFQFDQDTLIETVVTSSLDVPTVSNQPMFVRIKRPAVNREKSAVPLHVTIVPKQAATKPTYSIVKPIPIAPKQTPVPQNNTPGFKKLQFLTQVGGKQIMMMPSAGQRFKMVHSAGGIRYLKDEDDEISNAPGQTTKPLKVIVQGKGSDFSNTPAMLTKVVQQPLTTLVSVNKSVPVINTVGNKMVNIPIQLRPKPVMAARSPVKVLPGPNTAGRKVLIPASPARKVVLKTVRRYPTTPAQVVQTPNAVMNVTSGPARTRLHQVHIPGKGVKYIRLTTENSTPEIITDPTSGKTYMLTYNKGNTMPVSEENVTKSQPPLVVTSGKVNTFVKNQKMPIKLTSISKKITRSPQSLLAPIIVPSEPEPQSKSEGEDRTDHDRTQEDLNDSKDELRRMMVKDNMDVRRVTSQGSETGWKRDEDGTLSKPESYRLVVNPETFARNQSFNDSDFQLNLSPEESPALTEAELKSRPRKACNCNKSQCLKLYCECFANGEFCKDCNCLNCHNNLVHDDARRNAILGCLERNPDAFRPKIGKARSSAGPSTIRRHNKGCNCKRSGCLKNYCECYEAKIACTAICKCVGCRNVEDGGERTRKITRLPRIMRKQPCRLLTSSVIEAAVQCLLAAAAPPSQPDAVRSVLTEYARCLHAVIAAARHAQAIT